MLFKSPKTLTTNESWIRNLLNCSPIPLTGKTLFHLADSQVSMMCPGHRRWCGAGQGPPGSEVPGSPPAALGAAFARRPSVLQMSTLRTKNIAAGLTGALVHHPAMGTVPVA